MKSDDFDFFYSSDLGRAMHTSRLVGGPSGWEAIPREDLRERDLGVLEALTTEEMLESEAETYRSFRNDGPEYVPPGGESFKQFCDRCSKAVEAIALAHGEQNWNRNSRRRTWAPLSPRTECPSRKGALSFCLTVH